MKVTRIQQANFKKRTLDKRQKKEVTQYLGSKKMLRHMMTLTGLLLVVNSVIDGSFGRLIKKVGLR